MTAYQPYRYRLRASARFATRHCSKLQCILAKANKGEDHELLLQQEDERRV
jgi:hypothetical protein